MSKQTETITTAASTVLSDRRYTYAAIIGTLIGLSIFGLWFFQIDPIYTWVGGTIAFLQPIAISLVTDIQKGLAGIWTTIQQNPGAAITGGISAVTVIYTVISKISASRKAAQLQIDTAKQISEAQKAVITTGQKLTVANATIDAYKEKMAAYENDTSFAEAEKLVLEQRTKITSQADQIAELEKTILSLKLQEKEVVH